MLGPGSDMPNVAKAPMALSLFYILTAHHETDSAFDAETQQKLMGYARRPSTTSPSSPIGPGLTARSFSTLTCAATTTPSRLSCVPSHPKTLLPSGTHRTRALPVSRRITKCVVLLEPEKPQTMPGIVLNLGTFRAHGRAASRPQPEPGALQDPGKNGGTIQQVEATPARVTLDVRRPPAAHNRLLLLGTNLTAGKSRLLFLKNSLWAKLPPPGGPVEQTMVDLSQNPGWESSSRPVV